MTAREPEAVLGGLRLSTDDGLHRLAVVLFGRDSDRVAAEYLPRLLRVARFRGTSGAPVRKRPFLEFLFSGSFRLNRPAVE